MAGGLDVGEGWLGLRSSLGGTGGGVLSGVVPGLDPLLPAPGWLWTVVGVVVELPPDDPPLPPFVSLGTVPPQEWPLLCLGLVPGESCRSE